MKALLAIALICLGLAPCSHADYAIPVMSKALPIITDILDVKVTEMNDKGHASIEILKAYKRSKRPAKLITGTELSCTGGSPQMFGMKAGQRYIVMLVGSSLYEEGSYFPVKTENGASQCQLRYYGGKTWFNSKGPWMPLKEFETKLTAALLAQKAER